MLGKSGFLFFVLVCIMASCNKHTPDSNRILIAEVNNQFLYLDELEQIVPPSKNEQDSAEIANMYIRKWATDILMYDKAVQNTSDLAEIERLVSDYRKTLIVHQYQQRLVEQRTTHSPSEEDMKNFYEVYKSQMVLKENMLKGLLLVVPEDAPQIKKVYEWVKKGDIESIESIDKYSLQNAISYDYFMDKWVPLAEIGKKTPFNFQNPTEFLAKNQIAETSDSTHHYFLRIEAYATVGQTEPYELAKEKIKNILENKSSIDYVSQVEKEIYNDALVKQILKIYKP